MYDTVERKESLKLDDGLEKKEGSRARLQGREEGLSLAESLRLKLRCALLQENVDPAFVAALKHRSLFFLTPDNKFRKKIVSLLRSKTFNSIVMIAILVNTLFLSIYDPVKPSKLNQMMDQSDDFFNAFFAAEMLLKIIAFGFVSHPGSYLRTPWNVLDFLLVISGFLTYMSDTSVSGVRVLRLLRPLRAIVRVPEIRALVSSIIGSIPGLVDVFVLFVFFLILFGNIGVQLWQGVFRNRCVDTFTGEIYDTMCSLQDGQGVSCPSGQTCTPNMGPNPFNGVINFDNVGSAMISVFQVVTLDNWPPIMYMTMDSYSGASAIFFVFLIFLGTYFTVNLALVTVNETFQVTFARQKELKEAQKKWKRLFGGKETKYERIMSRIAVLFSTEDEPPSSSRSSSVIGSPNSMSPTESFYTRSSVSVSGYNFDVSSLHVSPWIRFRLYLRRAIEHPLWTAFFTLAIIMNTVFMAIDYYGRPTSLDQLFVDTNLSFNIIFIFELVIKVTALGPKAYFLNKMNLFDFSIVVLGLVDLFAADIGANLNVFRSFRLLRALKVVRAWPSLGYLLTTILQSLTSVSYLILLLALVLFIYALLGMQFFGGEFPEGSRFNFDDLFWAWTSAFVVLTGEGWAGLMIDAITAKGYVSVVYFVSLFVVGNYLLLNVFIAILINKFTERRENNPHKRQRKSASLKHRIKRSLKKATSRITTFLKQNLRKSEKHEIPTFEPKIKTVDSPQHDFLAKLAPLVPPTLPSSLPATTTVEMKPLGLLDSKLFPSTTTTTTIPIVNNSISHMQIQNPKIEFLNGSSSTTTPSSNMSSQRSSVLPDPGSPELFGKLAQSQTDFQLPLNAIIANTHKKRQKKKERRTRRKNEDAISAENVDDHYSSTSEHISSSSSDSSSGSSSESELGSMSDDPEIINMEFPHSSRKSHEHEHGHGHETEEDSSEKLREKARVLDHRTHPFAPELTNFEGMIQTARVAMERNWQEEEEDSKEKERDKLHELHSIAVHGSATENKQGLVPSASASTPALTVRLEEDPPGRISLKIDYPAAIIGIGKRFLLAKIFNESAQKIAKEPITMSAEVKVAGLVTPKKFEILPNQQTGGQGKKSGSPTSPSSNFPFERRSSAIHFVITGHETSLDAIPPSPAKITQVTSIQEFPHHETKTRKPCFPLRKLIRKLVTHRYFEWFIMFLILLSCVTLALYDPKQAADSELHTTLRYFDFILTILFTLEACLKMFAFGLVKRRHGYFKSAWNWFDFAIVTVSIVDLTIDSESVRSLRSFRLLRSLRPLRFIQRNEALRVVVRALLSSLPAIGDIGLISLLIMLLFAICGVQIFGGQFYSCTDGSIAEQALCVGYFINSDGEVAPRLWETYPQNFDNVLNGLLTLFQVMTCDNWTDILLLGIDARVPGLAPQKDFNPSAAFFFFFWIFIGSFFVLNLFVGVLVDNFQDLKKSQSGILVTQAQAEWRKLQRALLSTKPFKKKPPPRSALELRRQIWKLVSNQKFDIVVSIVIACNVIVLCMEYYDSPHSYSLGLEYANYTFVAFFGLEAILKILAFGMAQYYRDRWNKFDFAIVLISIISIAANLGAATNILRLLRLVRIFRLVRLASRLRNLISTLFLSLPSLLNIACLMFILYFVYACLGVQLFAKVKLGETMDIHSNFQSFPNALLTLFRITTGDSWSSLMMDCSVQPPNCDPSLEECGDPTAAAFYFTTFVVLCSFTLLNLFIAVIVENFNMGDEEGTTITVTDVEAFADAWTLLDPSKTYTIPLIRLPDLLSTVPPPLGLAKKGVAYSNVQILEFVKQLRLHDLNGRVHYKDVLESLAMVATKIPDPESQSQDPSVLSRIQQEKASMMAKWDAKVFESRVHSETLLGQGSQRVNSLDVMAAVRIQTMWRAHKVRKQLIEELGPSAHSSFLFLEKVQSSARERKRTRTIKLNKSMKAKLLKEYTGSRSLDAVLSSTPSRHAPIPFNISPDKLARALLTNGDGSGVGNLYLADGQQSPPRTVPKEPVTLEPPAMRVLILPDEENGNMLVQVVAVQPPSEQTL